MISRAGRYLEAVADLRSIRRAADVLRIAPSAVDRQIVQLERELGTPLFERTSKGLRLTEAGVKLVETVRRQRRSLARARSQIDDLRGLRRGEVVIAIIEGASAFIADALAEFRKRYSDVVVHVKIAGSAAVVDMTLSGEVEFGLAFNPPNVSSLRVERSLIFQIGAIVASSSPLACEASISVHECNNYPLILPNDAVSIREIAEQIWQRLTGRAPSVAFEVSSIAMLRSLVEAGLGIGLATPIDLEGGLGRATTFLPLTEYGTPLSVLSLVSITRHPMAVPASLLFNIISRHMENYKAPSV